MPQLEKPAHSTRQTSGFLLGLAGASFFGFIPIFAVPLLKEGYTVETIALYRFGLAAIVLLPCVLSKIRLWRPALLTMGIAIFYFLDVTLFFHALKYLSGGITATLEFLCPVFTVAIMILFFHEKFQLATGFAIALSIAGASLLGWAADSDAGATATLPGIILALLAALCNALYYVGFKWPGCNAPDSLQTTFFVMLSCSLCCLVNGQLTGGLEWIKPGMPLIHAASLALVTAVLSNVCLVAAIKRIGPAPVSILGVMEPVTAVLAGMLWLNEKAALPVWAGLLCSILAVLCVMHTQKQG